MNAILRGLDRAFDLLFRFLRLLPPALALAVLVVVTAIAALLVFRWVSNQKAIRKAKDRIGAHVLEIRLFPDQLNVVGRAYLAMLTGTFAYLRHALRPVTVLFLPLFLLFVQMEAYFNYKPLPVSEDFLLKYEIGRAHVELQSQFHLVCRLLLEKKKLTEYFMYHLYTHVAT